MEGKIGEGEAYWNAYDTSDVSTCVVCGSSTLSLKYADLSDRLEGLPGRWGFVSCETCGTIMLNPQILPHAVSKAYPPSYQTHASGVESFQRDQGQTFAWKLANDYLNWKFGTTRSPSHVLGRWLIPLVLPVRQQLDYFFRHLPPLPGRLLDVGCGDGSFLLRANEAGWAAMGVEPDPLAAEFAAASGFPVVKGFLEEVSDSDSFDYVTASHVFEHVTDPAVFLKQCLRLLKPGGGLWLSMPNVSGMGHRRFKKNWFSLDPPRHLFLPTHASVVRMLEEAGFTEVTFKRRGRGSKTSISMSQKYERESQKISNTIFPWIAFVDLLSSFVVTASDEIVVTAVRPSSEPSP